MAKRQIPQAIKDRLRSMTPESLEQVTMLKSGRQYEKLINELVDFEKMLARVSDPDVQADLIDLVETGNYTEFMLLLDMALVEHLLGGDSPFHASENLNDYSGKVIDSVHRQDAKYGTADHYEIELRWARAFLDPDRDW